MGQAASVAAGNSVPAVSVGGILPCALIVISNVSRLEYFGDQPIVRFSFSFESSHEWRANSIAPGGVSDWRSRHIVRASPR